MWSSLCNPLEYSFLSQLLHQWLHLHGFSIKHDSYYYYRECTFCSTYFFQWFTKKYFFICFVTEIEPSKYLRYIRNICTFTQKHPTSYTAWFVLISVSSALHQLFNSSVHLTTVICWQSNGLCHPTWWCFPCIISAIFTAARGTRDSLWNKEYYRNNNMGLFVFSY